MGRNIETVHFPDTAPKLKRVAAYARVSSGKDAMLHSLSAQISEYSSRIQNHPGWQYAAFTRTKPKPAQKTAGKTFRGLCQNAAPEMSIWSSQNPSPALRGTRVTLLETVR